MSDHLPTSNYEVFRQHLLNPNKPYELSQQEGKIMKVQKNLVISYVSDSTGCGHIRNIFPMTYLNSIFGKTRRFNIIISPVMLFQHDVLIRTRSIFFQRTMAPGHIQAIKMYKDAQKKYGFKMIYDVDDFIYSGSEEGESIPDYNFGKEGITPDVQKASLEIMNEMDVVCVSTDFLGQYIKNHGVTKPKIITVYNAVPQYFWGPHRKKPIKNKIEKPRLLYSGSPTHYHNQKKLKGDLENIWCEWIIKNIIDKKIDFCCMGGLPFFFEGIKDKIKVVDWVGSYQYHLPIKDYRPDFMIGPLVPNFFNFSKSDIKAIETYSIGAVFIGNTWKGTRFEKYPSPYDNCPINVPYDINYENLDKIIWDLTIPENYNRVIKEQYRILDQEGRWLESEKYVKMLTEIL